MRDYQWRMLIARLEPCSHNSLVAYDGIYLRKPTNGESRGRLFPYRFNAFSCNSSNGKQCNSYNLIGLDVGLSSPTNVLY